MRFFALLLGACAAWAQLPLGGDLGPERLLRGEKAKEDRSARGDHPFAEALFLSRPAADWTALKLSTSSPVGDLSKLLYSGIYRQELLTLVELALAAHEPLAEVVRRRRDGAGLDELAQTFKLEFTPLQDKALAARLDVDAEVRLSSAPLTAPAAGATP